VIPRSVLLARASPSLTAASKLVGEAAVIFVTLAIAISASLVDCQQAAELSMQFEGLLAKDHETWVGEASFCSGNIGRVIEETRNGREKAPPG
jgi:hypothetical protein